MFHPLDELVIVEDLPQHMCKLCIELLPGGSHRGMGGLKSCIVSLKQEQGLCIVDYVQKISP